MKTNGELKTVQLTDSPTVNYHMNVIVNAQMLGTVTNSIKLPLKPLLTMIMMVTTLSTQKTILMKNTSGSWPNCVIPIMMDILKNVKSTIAYNKLKTNGD